MPDNQKDEDQNEEEEESESEGEGGGEEEVETSSGGGGFFQKVPSDMLFSPGGVVLLFFAGLMEALDVVIPDGTGASLTIELIPEVIFAILLKLIAGVPFLSQIISFVIERIPIISDVLPTWVIKMVM